AREHLLEFPRDVMVLAPCTSVFGLIGFSGRARRDHELATLLDGLARHYGTDWWFLAVHGFALGETGRFGEARRALSRSLELNPRNANAAHFFSHLLYEEGDNTGGVAYLEDWLSRYPREAPLHCHLNWHVATWQLERGDVDAAWETYEHCVSPNGSWGPAINTLTDSAAFLWRTELSGHPRDVCRWQTVRDYALRSFPRVGVSYADVHAALAFAAAGDTQSFGRLSNALRELEQADRLPAGSIVPALAEAFGAAVNADWDETIRLLEPVIGEHERIGGSRAQRDLVEYTLLKAYVETRRLPDAERLRARARNRGLTTPVAGLI
ncbi:MAG: tetratricopeptide repeat protein, partial [Betaproteobacteria bacterium]